MARKPEYPEELREYFRQVAEEGNYPSKGGTARADALTKAERTKIASDAAKARWAKVKKAATKKKGKG